MPFSVIIPTYKRPETLTVAFDSVLKSTLLPSEIIVIDDDVLSDDLVFKMSQECEALKVPFTYHRKDHSKIRRGLSESKNLAPQLAENDILFFLDDDVELDSEYFSEMMKVWKGNWEDAKFIGASGHVINNRHQSWFEQRVFNYIFGLTGEHAWDINDVGFQVWDNTAEGVQEAFYLHGCSSSYRKTALLEFPFATFAGGRTALEDVAHGLEIKKAGYHFLYIPEAHLMHYQAAVSREAAFPSGMKESRNRKEIFRTQCPSDLRHKTWFYWTNIGWVVKKLLALKFREASGMITGLFKV